MNDATRAEALDAPLVRSQELDLVGEFLNRYRDSSFRIALRILGDPDAAEDVAQEALIRAFRSWDRFSAVERQSAWVRKTVVRCALSAIERTPRHETLPDWLSSNEGTPEKAEVQAVLNGLQPDHRILLGLAVGEGLSYREVSEILEIPMGTVASRVHTAKLAFRKAWEGSR